MPRESVTNLRVIKGGAGEKTSLPLLFAVAILAACIVFLVPRDLTLNLTAERKPEQ